MKPSPSAGKEGAGKPSNQSNKFGLLTTKADKPINQSELETDMKPSPRAGKSVQVSYNWFWFYFILAE